LLPVLSQLLVTTSTIFLSPVEANARMTANLDTVVLDARLSPRGDVFLPGAQLIDWRDYIDVWGPKIFNLWALSRNGQLDSNLEKLKKSLGRYGMNPNTTVVVYGASTDAWGEEGRIWWMLSYLGFSNVYIIDGGLKAWLQHKLPTQSEESTSTGDTRFELRLVPGLRADAKRTSDSIKKSDALILDTRSREEYEGQTPSYSPRGGHIPSASHLSWRFFFDDDGRVRGPKSVTKKLTEFGAKLDTPIITYCTGGVRSAMVQAVLIHSGFTKVANYDGSWWDWSKRKNLPIKK
jgi:thiosulfate/3-mercaptopyruvate sulfurtransferase